ncbi:uncharacterized protein TRUGW13939_05721 [Talaromyces rugulosus]|uniref:Putative gamma-glutamylcyclotransferase n=1 Tax=Talaromyces rugulosus TaxID=121627 RepID=A0A7H8QXT5_TALRU|nr:uncharacterized protein TRUGW13939_05721 [Talaromyces rugulosus]QKX58596.1 hypothetical protein TRUGW13939_05721 [Talaromyces rugulosus]
MDVEKIGPRSSPPEKTGSLVSRMIQKLQSAPPANDFFEAPTGSYFFYGTLSDPSMLRDILELQSEPELRPASVTGYACKLWGQYPALVDAQDLTVEGAVYHVQTVDHGKRLAAYETSSYHAQPCRIRYSDGKEPSQDFGYTFMFVGDPDDLSEGEFGLKVWLKRMGRGGTADNLDNK